MMAKVVQRHGDRLPETLLPLRDTFEQFATCLNDADVAVIAPVYAAGEAPIEGINRDTYAEALRGTVGTFGQERAAVADTRRTRGVNDVYDELEVRLLDSDRRIDAEIRGAALQRLMEDPMLDADYLDVDVKDGWVTLTGDADRQFQSDKAFDHMTSVRGVTGVTNKIRVDERL